MRILVLGATGMMGHAASRLLAGRHEVYGTGRTGWCADTLSAAGIAADNWVEGIEASRIDSVAGALERVKPDAVLNCIGIVRQLAEAKDAILSVSVNSLFPHRLAQLCGAAGVKLVHLSTDCVFSGRKGSYTEDDIPDPADLYGRSKLLGEVGGQGALTLRTSMIGRQFRGRYGLVEWFVSQRGRKVNGCAGAIFTGFTTAALAGIIEEVLVNHRSLTGVWHVASQPINKYDLLVKLNRRMGLGIEIERDEDFRCDRSLDGSRFAEQTGIVIPGWDNMIDAL